MKRSFLILALASALSLNAEAQIVTTGNDPGAVRWSTIGSDVYKIIYPRGLDSLARVYAAALEQVRLPVSGSIGYVPNQSYSRPMPVVLHAYTANSNGMVAWTPRQTHLYTTPDPFNPQPLPWVEQLVVHESRHIAQMQYVNSGPYRPFRYITGELFAGAAAALYCGPAFFEGDAVLAETELSKAGRGRSGDFLEYMRLSFLSGDTRNYWRWRYGSQKLYTPDHYRVGYLTMAGMRTVFDDSDFTRRYYSNIFKNRWPFPLFVFSKTVKEVSGLKFNDAFAKVCEVQTREWREDALARGSAMPGIQVSQKERLYTDYSTGDFLGGHFYSVRSGLDRTPELVRDGRRVGSFSYSTSSLKSDGERLWWSEIVRDARWEMRSYSDIWYLDREGKRHRLTWGCRYYNPSSDGKRVAATLYPADGGSEAVVLDAQDGSVVERFTAPDSLQVVECVLLDGKLYASGVTPSGLGLYEPSSWDAVLKPSGCFISDLFTREGRIYFRSDLSGVGELYSLDPGSGETLRLTSTGSGASAFRFSENADTLWYSLPSVDGRYVHKTATDSLPEAVRADFSRPHRYGMAEELSATAPVPIDRTGRVEISEPKPYSKILNAIHFHSWLPLYVNVDAIQSASVENIASMAGLGATGMFQNELGTLYGTLAYHAAPSNPKWVHSGELKLTYRGIYPVFEGSLNLSSVNPNQYVLAYYPLFGKEMISLKSSKLSGFPTLSGSLKMYVPLVSSKGGWTRGLIPQAQISASNSIVNHGSIVPLNSGSLSLRGYVMQSIPSSCIFPRFGLGLEAGVCGRIAVTDLFSPCVYAYAYGYLPGIVRTHGIRLSAKIQKQYGNAPFLENHLNLLPRGFTGISSFTASYPLQSLATFEYAFPFGALDWSFLGPVAYIRNFEFKAHTDLLCLSKKNSTGSLCSLGGTIQVRLGNLLWIPYTTRIGVTCSWNGGSAYDSLVSGGVGRVFVGTAFSIDL